MNLSPENIKGNIEKLNRGFYRLNQDTENELFQNANELYYKAKKKKSGFLGSNVFSQNQQEMKGAIILCNSKELINQSYAFARRMDP